MKVVHITQYHSNDGVIFDKENYAVRRDTALEVIESIKQRSELLQKLREECGHELVYMTSHQGSYSDAFTIECKICLNILTVSHSDSYWCDRYRREEGVEKK